MNLLLIIRYKLKGGYFISLYAVLMVLPALAMTWHSKGPGSSPIFLLGIGTFFCSAILFGRMREAEKDSTEFWSTLPFSSMQIFLARVGTWQILFLQAFLSCVGIILLLGSIDWSWETLLVIINAVVCNSVVSFGVLYFWRPSELVSQTKAILIGVPSIFLMAGTVIAVVALTNRLGLWPTYVALAASFPLYFVLRAKLREVEPLTGKRPLLEADGLCTRKISYPSFSEPSRRPVTFGDLASDSDTSENAVSTQQRKRPIRRSTYDMPENAVSRLLQERLSPETRYVMKSVWMDRMYIIFFAFVAMMMLVFSVDNKQAYGLLFVFVAGGILVTLSNKSVRALSPLPIKTLRLFFLVCGPYFAMIAFFVLVPCCFEFWQENKDSFYIGLFGRTSAFFLFLFGIRISCRGGVLADVSKKPTQKPLQRKPRTMDEPDRRRIDLMSWIEPIAIWLSVGILIIVFTGSSPNGFVSDYFDFRVFLLDHYLGCWMALLLGTFIFYRMSLQAFRRVY